MSERVGDCIQTYSGIEFYPFDPRPNEILLDDIAHALSHQCRFAGHTSEFYSVAEHCIRVAGLVKPEHTLAALLHDAAEAYLGDLPRPIKHYSEIGRLYKEAEERLLRAILNKFGVDSIPQEVYEADRAMLYVEAERFLKPNLLLHTFKKYLRGRQYKLTRPMQPSEAKDVFTILVSLTSLI